MCHCETDPIARHDLCQSAIIRTRPIDVLVGKEGCCGCMELGAGGKGELEHGRRISVEVDSRRGHLVSWAIDDEITKPSLALEECRVEIRAWIELIKA